MIDHLADLESDFAVLHRVDDIYQLDGPQFMRKAWRMSAYQGVMRMRLEAQAQAEESAASSPAPSVPAARRPSGGDRVVPLSAFAAQFPGAVERVTADAGVR